MEQNQALMDLPIYAIRRTREVSHPSIKTVKVTEWLTSTDGVLIAAAQLWRLYKMLNDTDLVTLAIHKNRKVEIVGNSIVVTYSVGGSDEHPYMIKQTIRIVETTLRELMTAKMVVEA